MKIQKNSGKTLEKLMVKKKKKKKKKKKVEKLPGKILGSSSHWGKPRVRGRGIHLVVETGTRTNFVKPGIGYKAYGAVLNFSHGGLKKLSSKSLVIENPRFAAPSDVRKAHMKHHL